MYTVIRNYSGKGARELFDLLVERQDEVKKIISSVSGFVSYSLVRTGDGGFSVTVTKDKAGADESVEKARSWVGANASAIGAGAPLVLEGMVVVQS